jgi:hypothetical protein
MKVCICSSVGIFNLDLLILDSDLILFHGSTRCTALVIFMI